MSLRLQQLCRSTISPIERGINSDATSAKHRVGGPVTEVLHWFCKESTNLYHV